MNETCMKHALNMPDIGGCPYCEIDRFKAELEDNNAHRHELQETNKSLRSQLAEARAEVDRLKSDLKYVGEHCVNPEEQAVMIAEARQEAFLAGAAAMRERCAEVAEELDIEPGTCNEYGELPRKYDSWVNGTNDACAQVAAAIRGQR